MYSYESLLPFFRMSNKEDFRFVFTSKNLVSTLEVPVPIPLKQPLDEFVGQLVVAHNLPCFVEKGSLILLACQYIK